MSTAPLSMRRHIVFFGRTNSGKSSLFNAVLGQQAAIVSEKRGTTTDPVVKAMELIPFGPVALADTAGTGDFSDIGSLRMKKSYDMLDRADVAVYCADPDDFSEEEYKKAAGLFDKRKIRHLLVFTKADITDGKTRRELCRAYPEALFVSSSDQAAVDDLKAVLNGILSGMEEEKPILSGLLSGGAHVVMCIPIDSAAPKGRLILPQVQLIRECLDLGMTCSCATPDQLGLLIKNCEKVDLVVTDSQAFGQVAGIVPEDIKLTSFSMLLAAQKGDIKAMIDGAKESIFCATTPGY